jgi:hypothetical protein
VIHKVLTHYFSDQEFGSGMETGPKDSALRQFMEDRTGWLQRLLPGDAKDPKNSMYVHQSLFVVFVYSFLFESDTGIRYDNPAKRIATLVSSNHERFRLPLDNPLFQVSFLFS